jgi:hypothetical protein
MQDEPIPSGTGRESARAESTILDLLLHEPHPSPWSVDELALAQGNRVASIDAIAELHSRGLIHLAAGFVWPTRAAVHAAGIEHGL